VLLLQAKRLARVLCADGFLVRPCRVATVVEAPRPTRDRTDGRSPGSRVRARHRLPGL